jgi:hypothetical protein
MLTVALFPIAACVFDCELLRLPQFSPNCGLSSFSQSKTQTRDAKRHRIPRKQWWPYVFLVEPFARILV